MKTPIKSPLESPMESPMEGNLRYQKNRLVNQILAILLITGTFALVASIYRARDMGWIAAMNIHLALWIFLVAVVALRDRLTYAVKSTGILVLLAIIAVTGLATFGLYGGSVLIWLSISTILAAMSGLRLAIASLLVPPTLFLAFGAMTSLGYWHYATDFNLLTSQFSSWLSTAVGFICFGTLTVLIVGRMYQIINANMEVIARQRDELKFLNETKTKMFSVISHDMREPFNSLIAMVQLFEMQDNRFTTEQRRQHLKAILSKSENIANLLNNLLAWSLSQLNNTSPNIQTIDLDMLIEECILPHQPAADRKQIALRSQVDEDVFFEGELANLGIVIGNLVSNAIKFTQPGGEVVVAGGIRAGQVEITVQDNGVGIPPEFLPELFGRVGQHTTRGTGNERGAGLGLVLCRELTERQGGRISVKSQVGKGSCFTIMLPLAQQAASPEEGWRPDSAA